MLTYEEVKKNLEKEQIYRIEQQKKLLENSYLRSLDKEVVERVINNCETNLRNIDEVTNIFIGSATNNIINAMQTLYDHFAIDGYYDQEKFANLLEQKFIKQIGDWQCSELGITVDDLMCFKDKSPYDSQVADMFRSMVNAKMGTNIPLSQTMKDVLTSYNDIPNTDTVGKAKAFVDFKEMERDAGKLRNGGTNTYYVLAENPQYLKAVEISKSMTM